MGVAIKKRGRGAVPLTKQAVRLIERLPEKHAKGAAHLASELAPRSEIDEPGYVHMADAISAKQEGKGKWKVEVEKDYGQYVEFGTIYQDAQPFFRPAMASAQRAMRKELKTVIPKR
jgi:HK97 gp10 family phage protein